MKKTIQDKQPHMHLKKSLGLRIRELRKEAGMSLRELGSKLGRLKPLSGSGARPISVSAAFLSDIENSRRFPSPSMIQKLAKVFNKTVEDLESHDTRIAGRMLEELVTMNAQYAFAFHYVLKRVIEEEIPPESIVRCFLGRK